MRPISASSDDVERPAEDQRVASGGGTAGGRANEQAADDLGARDDRGRQPGDAVGGRVAVELEQVRLAAHRRHRSRRRRERRREHQPADRRVAQAAVDRRRGRPSDLASTGLAPRRA